jgi:threonine dehydrogenase-like Zn-dependent dehydrogenase
MAEAPFHSRVVVVGVCMATDRVRPILGIKKELELRFGVRLHPARLPRRAAPARRRQGATVRLVTGEVGLPGVAAAFDALADPETHAKILVNPRTEAALLDEAKA